MSRRQTRIRKKIGSPGPNPPPPPVLRSNACLAGASMQRPLQYNAIASRSSLVLEVTVGTFYAVSSSLRSKYLPGDLQASIMNIFRLPLNMFVVLGTKMTDWYEPRIVFFTVSAWFLMAAALQWLMTVSKAADAKKQD